MRIRLLTFTALAVALCICPTARPAFAQSSPGWFVPPSQPAAPPPARASARPARQSAPPPAMDQASADQEGPADQGDGQGAQNALPPLPSPPVPALPPLPKGSVPPPVVIGVLGVPEVMHQSNAVQIIQRVIGARKEKLRAEADRAQASLKEMAESLHADAPRLSAEQARSRELALRARAEKESRGFQERNKIITEAGQVALNQVESTLLGVIKQVAESHGMNVVLHRSQVALNMPEFDITDEVLTHLNKLMPTVDIPAEDVDPATLPKDWGARPLVSAVTQTH